MSKLAQGFAVAGGGLAAVYYGQVRHSDQQNILIFTFTIYTWHTYRDGADISQNSLSINSPPPLLSLILCR